MRHIAQSFAFTACVIAGLVGVYLKLDWSPLVLFCGLVGIFNV